MRVTRVGDRFLLLSVPVGVITCQFKVLAPADPDEWSYSRQLNVPKHRVGDVSDKYPLDLDDALPFVLRPYGAAACVIDLHARQLGQFDKLTHYLEPLTGVNISATPQKCPLRNRYRQDNTREKGQRLPSIDTIE